MTATDARNVVIPGRERHPGLHWARCPKPRGRSVELRRHLNADGNECGSYFYEGEALARYGHSGPRSASDGPLRGARRPHITLPTAQGIGPASAIRTHQRPSYAHVGRTKSRTQTVELAALLQCRAIARHASNILPGSGAQLHRAETTRQTVYAETWACLSVPTAFRNSARSAPPTMRAAKRNGPGVQCDHRLRVIPVYDNFFGVGKPSFSAGSARKVGAKLHTSPWRAGSVATFSPRSRHRPLSEVWRLE